MSVDRIIRVKCKPLAMGHFAHVNAFVTPFAGGKVRATASRLFVSASISHTLAKHSKLRRCRLTGLTTMLKEALVIATGSGGSQRIIKPFLIAILLDFLRCSTRILLFLLGQNTRNMVLALKCSAQSGSRTTSPFASVHLRTSYNVIPYEGQNQSRLGE